MKLTVVVLTHNDEERIVDCLESVQFADELLVVDDYSQDRTIELAKQFTKNVLNHELRNNFANHRNYALDHAHGEWVLFVDSDEIVSQELGNEIVSKIKNAKVNGYFLKRIDVMWGEKILHGEAGEVRLLRLAKKDSGKWHGKVHETWRIRGSYDELINPLFHTPHQSVREFVKDVDMYSTLRTEELAEAGIKSSFFAILIYPFMKFILNYIFKRGYRDGIPGFLYAMTMSFHSFLVRAKLYLRTNT